MADWGTSPLGNLAQFEAPTFKTGEGLAAILALKQRQQEHAQQLGANIGGSVADAMQQRKKDEMYNALMDQYSKEYGVANPFAGQGEQGFMAAKELIKIQQSTQDQSLQARMAEARISRMGRASTGGDGGGGGADATTSGLKTIWHNGIEYRPSASGRGWVPIKTEATGVATDKGAAVKPRTQHQQDQLELDVQGLRDLAKQQEAENIKKGAADKNYPQQVPFTRQNELNLAAKKLGIDPVTGEPLPSPTPSGTPMPKTQIAESYGVKLPVGSERIVAGVKHTWDGMKWVPVE